MIIEDEGILLHLRRLKENGIIASFFTKNHGKIVGFMRKSNAKFGSELIPGNLFVIRWQARLEEHLGAIKVEIMQNNFYKTMSRSGGAAISYITTILMRHFKEKAKATELYEKVEDVFSAIDLDNKLHLVQSIFRFELALLQEMGCGINMGECAMTGSEHTEPLYYMSPKTGAACTKAAGAAYHNKLFIIPEFFHTNQLLEEDVASVNRLICHYLMQYQLLWDDLASERANIIC